MLKGGDVNYMTKDARKRFTFRLPGSLFDNLKKEADKQGLSLNAMILQILWEWVKKRKLESGKETPAQEQLDSIQRRK